MSEKKDIKIAAFCLAFNVNESLHEMISNIGKHVEKIYIAYSLYPWSYNKKARQEYTNNTSLEFIKESPFSEKIEIVEGVWDSDEDQRNSCVEKALSDGYEYLIVQDSDEFILDDEFENILNEVKAHPQVDLFKLQWYQFWKSTDFLILDKTGSMTTGTPEYIINLKNGVHFTDRRITNARNEFVIPCHLFHLGYVHSDATMKSKISTWGHSHELFSRNWYKNKWLHWNEKVKYLHPVRPEFWLKATSHNLTLPEELEEWKLNNGIQYEESSGESLYRALRDYLTPLVLKCAKLKRSLKRRLPNRRGQGSEN